MSAQVNLENLTSHPASQIQAAIRQETFGADIGQSSWLTVEELDRYAERLQLQQDTRLLEIACGTGGTALYLAEKFGCQVIGVDLNSQSLASARKSAILHNLKSKLQFIRLDANRPLPFTNEAFDALLCIDSINYLDHRFDILQEWFRLLRPSGRMLYSDPGVITGPVSAEDITNRSSIGAYLYLPPGENERLIAQAGFRILRREDLTENEASIALRWYHARQRHRAALEEIEGKENMENLQRFFICAHTLASERRLSRFAYLAEKPAPLGPPSYTPSKTSGLPFGRLV